MGQRESHLMLYFESANSYLGVGLLSNSNLKVLDAFSNNLWCTSQLLNRTNNRQPTTLWFENFAPSFLAMIMHCTSNLFDWPKGELWTQQLKGEKEKLWTLEQSWRPNFTIFSYIHMLGKLHGRKKMWASWLFVGHHFWPSLTPLHKSMGGVRH